jgi:hypothetical protein
MRCQEHILDLAWPAWPGGLVTKTYKMPAESNQLCPKHLSDIPSHAEKKLGER